MILHRRRAALCVAVLFVLPNTATAQIGPLIDWINKMSGPQFWGIETSVTLGHRPGQFLPSLSETVSAVRSARATPPMAEMDRCLTTIQELHSATGDHTFDEKRVDRVRMRLPTMVTQIRRLDGNRDDSAQLAQTALACALRDQVLDLLDHEVPRWGLFVRLGGIAAVNEKYKDEDVEEPEIFMLAFQPTAGVEYMFGDGVGAHPALTLEAGMTLYHFFGEIEDFRHHAFLGLISIRPWAADDSRILRAVRTGVGARGFPQFNEQAFGPSFDLADGWEWVGTFFLGFDFTIGY